FILLTMNRNFFNLFLLEKFGIDPFPRVFHPLKMIAIFTFSIVPVSYLRLFSQKDDNLIFGGKVLATQFVNSRLDEAAFCRLSASVSVDAFTILAISQTGEQFFQCCLSPPLFIISFWFPIDLSKIFDGYQHVKTNNNLCPNQ